LAQLDKISARIAKTLWIHLYHFVTYSVNLDIGMKNPVLGPLAI